MTSRFISHENCPSCGSKDNLGVWDDNHKYCFGCGYYKSGTTNVKTVFEEPKNSKTTTEYPHDITSTYPIEALKWLNSCGITNSLQKQYQIHWSPSKQLICWKIWGSNGTIIGWQGRCFAKNAKTKYVIHGKIHDDICILPNTNPKPTTIVLVEDYLSAIRVSNYLPCMPLFSCNISTNHLQGLSKTFKKIIVWLDSDKLDNARKIAIRISLLGIHGQVLYTQNDPKNYTDTQIKDYLEALV